MSSTLYKPLPGKPWAEYTAGTNAGATATHAAESEVFHYITAATFFTDADSLLTIKSNSTTVWEGFVDVSVDGRTVHVSFPDSPLRGERGDPVSAIVTSSTGNCAVTLTGFSRGK